MHFAGMSCLPILIAAISPSIGLFGV